LLDQPSNLEEETEAALESGGFENPSRDEGQISHDNCVNSISQPNTPKISCKPHPLAPTYSMPDLLISPQKGESMESPFVLKKSSSLDKELTMLPILKNVGCCMPQIYVLDSELRKGSYGGIAL